jgi:hypothetical protein
VGVDDQHAARAVDDEQVVVLDQRACVLHADHRRDRQAARDDGGVRGAAAHVGDETADPEGLELEGVGRRKVVGHHDQVVLGGARLAFHQLALPALQHLEHALDHLHDVLLALAQVGILEFVELVDHQLHLLHHGPLGIAAAFADQLAHAVGQRRIGQDHGMDIDEGGQLGRRPEHAGVRAQGVELGAGGAHGAVEALQLARHVAFAQLVVRDLQRRVRNQVRPPDRDAARDRLAVEAEGHGVAPPPGRPKAGQAFSGAGSAGEPLPPTPTGAQAGFRGALLRAAAAGWLCKASRGTGMGGGPFIRLRRICRRSAPAGLPRLPRRARPRCR